LGGIGIYITALVMGLAGSLHCLGMCGPIFVAASGFYNKPKEYLLPLFLHHLGKLVSYAALGLVMGLLGKGASLLWFQNKIMVVCGVLLLCMALGTMLKLRHISKLNDWVSIRMGKALNNSKMAGLVLGFVNGLVPCGLVYAAAIGAAATQSYTGGVVFMLMFGLGTIPALSIAGLSRWLIPLKRMRNLGVWKQIPMLILGLWLLLKGLGLGIPYISPDLGSHKPNANCCERHTEKH
jgi:uncharacterized protein